MPKADKDGMKICSKCKEIKHKELFPKRLGTADGRQCHCKDCQKDYVRAWKAQNTEYFREYYRANSHKLNYQKRMRKHHGV